jgi:hypothetical protein
MLTFLTMEMVRVVVNGGGIIKYQLPLEEERMGQEELRY